ncbi:pilus assembly protein TadE [Burkholderia sp. SRS-W-2-2016]|uniref:TadE/TadG family type IV pilus assembly protein n=1 Tax=Burkholderia sp. SRS-W-2-2016 TaxID=1926878 RepID=UPI00094AA185|nr:TadE/TadG family type IV pilus assembly protein [Burkholderia sp. SRS-W-2-2016]OLL32044.1 pilus assembly protein TadE [Burkholderia sp. SRS-W-2-2016]
MNARNRQRAPRTLSRRARTQRGMAAIEFALVFPLFFVILYAIVTYSLILVAQQNLTLAASEGARAALNWQSNSSMSDALTRRASAACDAAKLVAATLVQSMHCTTTTTSCGPGNAMQCISVSLSFDYSATPLVPTLPGFGIALPNKLYGNATVQLNPENIQ